MLLLPTGFLNITVITRFTTYISTGLMAVHLLVPELP